MITGTFKQLDAWDSVAGPFIPGSGASSRETTTTGRRTACHRLLGRDFRWRWTACRPPVGTSTAQKRHHRATSFYAHLALCRAALIGASQTVWVLAPDKRDRRIERARTVAAYTQGQHEKYLKALVDWAPTPDAHTDAVLAHVQQRIVELTEKRTASNQKAALLTTVMIREAATEAFSADLAKEVVLAWQEASGAAHGLVWQLLGQQSTVQAGPANADGLAPFVATGSFDRIANPYMAAYHLADRGWNLMRREVLDGSATAATSDPLPGAQVAARRF